MDATLVYSDISANLVDSPSLGVFVPGRFMEAPLVASIAFPRIFLNGQDVKGNRVYAKTTALEAIAYLAVPMLDPMRFVEKEVCYYIDNIATVLALKRGYSRDSWTSTLVRAAKVFAAGIGCSIYAVWEPRRSSRASRIADNLTHNMVEELTEAEVDAYISFNQVSFPEPLLHWMSNPGPDQSLGRECLLWARKEFPGLRILRTHDL